jgi:hypothetical protein
VAAGHPLARDPAPTADTLERHIRDFWFGLTGRPPVPVLIERGVG